MKVGIPAGSRGIRGIAMLLREAANHIRSLGAEPILVTAMGSHGGGTVEGQLAVLESLGITAESVGAPVLGTVAADEIGRTAAGTPVYFDRALRGCDGVLMINRVKPHTSFRGPLESGLVKMLVVGCGKQPGAEAFHSLGPAELGRQLPEMGEVAVSRIPLIGGIAILENEREETADLVPVRPEEFLTRETGLQERSKRMLPGLPVDQLDLLIIDQMGKNFSGTGMDTNVVGRMGIRSMPDMGPEFKRIVVLDLSDESHGNANGVGLADLITRRLAAKIDYQATYLNSMTTGLLERAKIPMIFESDRAAILTALKTVGPPTAPRIARIPNTLELQAILVSPAVADELQGRSGLSLGKPVDWPFDAAGNLLKFGPEPS